MHGEPHPAMGQPPTALLPWVKNWGGCVGASPCAKTGPDPHVDEQPLLSSAVLAWDVEKELSGVSRNRMLESTPQQDRDKGLGRAGWLLLLVMYSVVTSSK